MNFNQTAIHQTVIVQTATLLMAIRQTVTVQTVIQTRMPIRHRLLIKMCDASLSQKIKREFFSFLQSEKESLA